MSVYVLKALTERNVSVAVFSSEHEANRVGRHRYGPDNRIETWDEMDVGTWTVYEYDHYEHIEGA